MSRQGAYCTIDHWKAKLHFWSERACVYTPNTRLQRTPLRVRKIVPFSAPVSATMWLLFISGGAAKAQPVGPF